MYVCFLDWYCRFDLITVLHIRRVLECVLWQSLTALRRPCAVDRTLKSSYCLTVFYALLLALVLYKVGSVWLCLSLSYLPPCLVLSARVSICVCLFVSLVSVSVSLSLSLCTSPVCLCVFCPSFLVYRSLRVCLSVSVSLATLLLIRWSTCAWSCLCLLQFMDLQVLVSASASYKSWIYIGSVLSLSVASHGSTCVRSYLCLLQVVDLHVLGPAFVSCKSWIYLCLVLPLFLASHESTCAWSCLCL